MQTLGEVSVRPSITAPLLLLIRFREVALSFAVMHFPGLWEPTAAGAGIIYASGCLHSSERCRPRLNFPGNELSTRVTNSSGYLNAKAHQTSGQATEVKEAGWALAVLITSVSLTQFNTLCAPGHMAELSERSPLEPLPPVMHAPEGANALREGPAEVVHDGAKQAVFFSPITRESRMEKRWGMTDLSSQGTQRCNATSPERGRGLDPGRSESSELARLMIQETAKANLAPGCPNPPAGACAW